MPPVWPPCVSSRFITTDFHHDIHTGAPPLVPAKNIPRDRRYQEEQQTQLPTPGCPRHHRTTSVSAKNEDHSAVAAKHLCRLFRKPQTRAPLFVHPHRKKSTPGRINRGRAESFAATSLMETISFHGPFFQAQGFSSAPFPPSVRPPD